MMMEHCFFRKTSAEIKAANIAARGQGDDFEAFNYYLHAITPNGRQVKVDSFSEMPAGSTALIGIKGALMMNDQYCGPMGTGTIGRIVESADRSAKISHILFDFDSPGGSAKGTQELGQIISSTKTPNTGRFVQAHSAAYWLLSACDEAVASSETAECGSIGVMIELADVRAFYKEMGIEIHTIRATDSVDKNQSYYDALDGKYENIRVIDLDPLNKIFQNTVRQNRNLPKDTTGTHRQNLLCC